MYRTYSMRNVFMRGLSRNAEPSPYLCTGKAFVGLQKKHSFLPHRQVLDGAMQAAPLFVRDCRMFRINAVIIERRQKIGIFAEQCL